MIYTSFNSTPNNMLNNFENSKHEIYSAEKIYVTPKRQQILTRNIALQKSND